MKAASWSCGLVHIVSYMGNKMITLTSPQENLLIYSKWRTFVLPLVIPVARSDPFRPRDVDSVIEQCCRSLTSATSASEQLSQYLVVFLDPVEGPNLPQQRFGWTSRATPVGWGNQLSPLRTAGASTCIPGVALRAFLPLGAAIPLSSGNIYILF